MYNPRPIPGISTNITLEFIELYNSKPWDEDISGFGIAGLVHYTFPSNTILRAGAYLVLARFPGLVQTNYSITNIIGPWDNANTTRLSTERGTVMLTNRQGAVLLQVDYADSPPWPETADGTGHSLVLARPSYGENDFRAWSQSDQVGGSPGRADPLTVDPLAPVVINEWQNHSDPLDWIELYNHSNVPLDLSGAWLSDDPTTNKFRIPNGTTIGARDFVTFDQNQVGFELFAGGESIFFWNSNQTQVLDVIDFRGQSNNVTSGRSPDGGPFTYGLARSTRGAPNSEPMRYPVVINEIMYNPISGNVDDEYVEIYNRSSATVNLAGWEFVVGISYVFPTNAAANMAPGAYYVIARNPTNLMAIYTNLNANNTFGPYSGTLANGGERLVLAADDYDTVLINGQNVEVKLQVPVSDLIYGDGGKWGNWSDGQGSSLELIDPQADVRLPSNWADSADPGESLWTAIEWTGPIGETLGPEVNDSLIIMMQGIGECLLDEVEVRVNNGPNLVANGSFESGLQGWTLQGSHDFSTIENEGFVGSKSLHVRAASRGDNQSNRILSAPFDTAIPTNATQVSIRAKAKWVRGHPELLLRLHGSATEAYGRMALPRKLGSPGAPNSRRVNNAGPAVYDVKHTPALPAANEPIVITARANDPQGIALVNLRYRVDPAPDFQVLPMADDGTGGDAVANDGIYTATLPGQASGTIVAFYIESVDGQGAIGTFPSDLFPPPGLTRCWPNDAVARECVVRWGETQMPGDFATYHLWLTSANSNRWHHRDAMNNTSMDGTFVYNNYRVIYNALPLYSGSPWHRANATNGPAGANRVDYEMNFPGDDPLLGSGDFVLNNPGNPDVLTVSDLSALAEQTVFKIFEGMGMVSNHRRYIHFFVNGSQRSTAYERPGNFIFEDSQQPNGDMIDEFFPNDAGGLLFKVEDWFEFDRNGYDFLAYNDADLARRTILLNGQPTMVPAPYRFMFRKRSVNIGSSANDYTPIFQLIDATSPAENPTNPVVDVPTLSAAVDWEAWMRFFAVQRAIGNFDSFGWARGKNDYLYRTSAGFIHMPWDIDYGLSLGRPANEPLFESNDPRVLAMFNTPETVRAYWRAFADLVAGPFSNANLDPFIDARATALLTNNINIDPAAVATVKNYIHDRRAYLLEQLATVDAPFAVDGPATFSTTNNLLPLSGTAPVTVKTISLNGTAYPVMWTTVSNFTLNIGLDQGLNAITLQGLDRFGQPLTNASIALNVTYDGPVVDTVGALVISEIMYAPAVAGGQFIEIFNRTQFSFDLRGWTMQGVNFTFPAGFIVTNGQTIVLAQNRAAFRSAYGNTPLAGLFTGSLSAQGQFIGLIKPSASGNVQVNAVRYEVTNPWPYTVTGAALQLIDPAQDNTRPSNWAMGAATPGATNTVAAILPPYDPVWLNEVQIESLNGPLDIFNESGPWIELYNSGASPINLDGYFLSDNYTNLTQWAFPAVAWIMPYEHVLVWADGQPEQSSDNEWHTSFRLSESGRIALSRLVNGQPQICDYVAWPRLGVNAAYGSFPDGQLLQRGFISEPTPYATNRAPALRVFINEWMARNSTGLLDPADGAADDWFELYNAESFTVDLSNYYLTDTALNPTRYRIPANGQYRIPAGGFLLVWADNQTIQNLPSRADLHAGFQLGGSAGDIGLFLPDGVTKVDLISYGQQTTDVSEGRFGDGASARYAMPRATPRAANSIPIYNSQPRFPVVTNQIVAPGASMLANVRATDSDGNTLTYSLITNPPSSQMLGSFVLWTVPTNQPLGTYPVTVRVTDNGTPARSNEVSFLVFVQWPSAVVTNGTLIPGPVIQTVASVNGQATFTIATLPGHTYRVYYKDDLNTPAWTKLGLDFVAANDTASLTDFMTVPKRFYWVLQVD